MATPKPFIPEALVTRVLDGDTLPDDGATLLTAYMRTCDTLAAVLRCGVSDRDHPTLDRAEATAAAINCAFLGKSIEQAYARRQQRQLFAQGANDLAAIGSEFFGRIALVRETAEASHA